MASGRQTASSRRKTSCFERAILEDRFDDEVGGGEILVAGRALNAVANRAGPIGPHDAAVDGFLQGPFDRRETARHFLVVHVEQEHVEAFGGHLLGNAAAHVAGADDTEDAEGPVAIHLNLSTTEEKRTRRIDPEKISLREYSVSSFPPWWRVRKYHGPLMRVRQVPLGPLPATLTRRPDGTMLVRTSAALGEYPKQSTERLAFWADTAPRRAMLSWRGAGGAWESLTYGEAFASVRRIGQALIDRGLSAERPVVILSGNDREHALLSLAAQHAGVTVAPVSPAYSTGVARLRDAEARDGPADARTGLCRELAPRSIRAISRRACPRTAASK